MEQQPQSPATPKQNLRASQILCLALLLGCTFFAAMMLLLNVTQGPTMPDSDNYGDIFLYAAIGIAIICIFIAVTGYNKRIAAAKNLTGSLDDKLNHYRGILIQYMAPCEGAGLFAIIVFFLTGNYQLLIIVALMLGLMLYRFPFKAKAIKELGLDWKEQQELE
jgi:hypothetical protein